MAKPQGNLSKLIGRLQKNVGEFVSVDVLRKSTKFSKEVMKRTINTLRNTPLAICEFKYSESGPKTITHIKMVKDMRNASNDSYIDLNKKRKAEGILSAPELHKWAS